MSRAALTDLRSEHQQLGVGRLLLAVIQATVRDVCRDYSPQVYAGSAAWDDAAFDEVLQRWTLERLLARGNLAEIVGSSESVGALHAMLRQSLRWHLAEEHAKGERSALARRVRKLLNGGASFARAGGVGSEARWTTTGSGPSRLDAVGLASIALELDDRELRVVERPRGTRASPLLPTDQLERLVTHVLDAAGGSVAFGDLIDALALRFGMFGGGRDALPPVDVPDPTDIEAESIERDRDQVRHTVVAEVAAGLGREARETVVAWQDDPSFAHVAKQLGVHPSTVRSRLEGVFDSLMECGCGAGLLVAVDDDHASTQGHMRLDRPSWVELKELTTLLGELLRGAGHEGVR